MRQNYWETPNNGGGKAPEPEYINLTGANINGGGGSGGLFGAIACTWCATTNSCINYETYLEANGKNEDCTPPFLVGTDVKAQMFIPTKKAT
jgi:hypothetical protein